MPRILLIDDDAQLGPPLAAYFARFDLTLECALRPSAGLARLRQGGLDAVILDVMLPEMDGFALCRMVRKESDIPIIMLTARGEVMDRVVGLELGADDYVPKPFEPRELVARLQTVLRRRVTGLPDSPAPQPVTRLCFDGLEMDATTRQVQRQGEALELTFDATVLPYLGLWICRAAWPDTGQNKQYTVALEPTHANCDSLADAERNGTAWPLAPGEQRAWSLRLRVTALAIEEAR